MSAASDASRLARLFLLPSPAASPLCAQRLFGVTHESSTTLASLLKDNHVRWHIFFNEKGFHNHASHFLLAIYQLGASPTLLEAAYKTECSFQRPAYKSPSVVTEGNLYKHLGDEDYYNAYVEFYTSAVLERGPSAILERYLFSPEANAPPRRMLNRFFSGVLHPVIHTGYGLELGLPGMIAEGLAMLYVQLDHMPDLVPWSFFESRSADSAVGSVVSNITTALSSVGLNVNSDDSHKDSGPHALAILAKIANDPSYAPSAVGIPVENPADETMLTNVLEARGKQISELMVEWMDDGAGKDAAIRKIEELIWSNVVIYGVGGWSGRHTAPGKKFNSDFFFMHLVTSVLFLHSYVPHLSAPSLSLLLRAYFSASLAMYVARGRPPLHIRAFYAAVPSDPHPPVSTPAPQPHKDALTADTASSPWLALLQSTLVHNDNHLAKVQRALAHFASLYGTTPVGRFGDVKGLEGLDGRELLDGTLFVRVAGLTQDRIGWMREGEENKGWDFDGFFE